MRPSGDYWVFLEVNEGAYGGRPRSDGPDSIDNLMANTRNNPLEDLAMHIPMICDRYELRDDVAPGAGRFRGGIGVVKAQRILTDGIITHESERHTNVPWGIFGGKPGALGKCDIYNVGGGGEVPLIDCLRTIERIGGRPLRLAFAPAAARLPTRVPSGAVRSDEGLLGVGI